MKEIKVGERVTITLEVVKAKGCSGCFFNNDRCVSGELGFDCILPNGTIWKKVAQYTIDGKLVKVWDSIVQAKRETGIGHISEVCCGAPHRHTAGVYIWKHVSENSEMEV